MDIQTMANWFTGFIEAYFLFMLCETFMSKRMQIKKYGYILGIICLGVIINVSNVLFSVTVMNMAVMIFFEIVFTFLYCGKLKMRIILPILKFMLAMVTEVVALLLISLLYNMNASEIIAEGPCRILGIVLSKLLCYAAVKYISNKFKRENVSTDVNYWLIFAVMFATTTFAMFTFCKMLEKTADVYIRNLAVISSCGLSAATIIALFLYERILRQKYIITQNQLSELNLKEQVKHYNDIMMTQGQVKRIRHDLKNHFFAIQAMIKNTDYDDCMNYIDSLIEDVNLSGVYVETGNVVIDAILGAKKTQADKLGIKFISNISIPANLPLSKEDECVIFGNALDNAIEAAEKFGGNKYVNVSLNYNEETLTCKISNSAVANSLVTTKRDAKNHGIGRENINRTLEKYNSVPQITFENNEYTLFFVIDGLAMN